MHRLALVPCVTLVLTAMPIAAQTPDIDQQIAAALLPLPESMRADAAVLGDDGNGEIIRVRSGRNHVICTTHFPMNPQQEYSAVCYHESMHSLVKRRRQLFEDGMRGEELQDRLTEEAKAGEIPLPAHAVAGYFMTGSGYEAASGIVENPVRWRILFTPFMTAAESGLADQEIEGMPWVMMSGTIFSHIMIPSGEGDA